MKTGTVAEIQEWHKRYGKDGTSGTTSERWNCTLLAEIERLEAHLKRAEAVCEAWAEYEPVKDFSALCGKQHMALREAYKAHLAGKKETDDGEETG